MRAAFLTLGCKVNYYETEKMKEQFLERGHTIVAFDEQADAYIVNTCSVTNIADRKSRKMLHRARRMNEKAIVVAAGCYVESSKKKCEADSSVDLCIGNDRKDSLVEILEEMTQERGQEQTLQEMSDAAREGEHTRAYVKVQSGCNQYCSYCVIPYVRGKLSSRPGDEVVAEVKKIAEKGVREVVLTGIHLSSYGVDFTDKKSFLELEGKPLLELIRAVAQVPGICRIRLGSLEPRIITDEFAAELSKIEKVCPHFHLSLQSGCDQTLYRMNRHYTGKEYLEKLDIIRKYYDHPAITTDIIVGFPGETEEEFDTTCEFVRKAKFSQIHVFKYSRRKGTMADMMDGQVPDEVKANRSGRLLIAGRELERLYCAPFVGKETEVLLEEVVNTPQGNCLTGYNERYVRVNIPVKDGKDIGELRNQIVTALVREKEYGGGCLGEITVTTHGQ